MLPPSAANEWWATVEGIGEVDRVKVVVTALAPAMDGGWLTEQAGGSTALNGVVAMVQDKATDPVKPPLGVMVMVEVPLDPADAMSTGVPLRENWPNPDPVPGATIVMATVVEALMVPEVPVTVIV